MFTCTVEMRHGDYSSAQGLRALNYDMLYALHCLPVTQCTSDALIYPANCYPIVLWIVHVGSGFKCNARRSTEVGRSTTISSYPCSRGQCRQTSLLSQPFPCIPWQGRVKILAVLTKVCKSCAAQAQEFIVTPILAHARGRCVD